MRRRDRDAMVGAGVLLAGAVLLFVAYGRHAGAGSNGGGYVVTARFTHAGGIGVGSPVRLSGTQIGKVVGERLDKQYRAVVSLRLTSGVQLPDDTSAAILTDGLLGPKYIELQPGADETNLKSGSEILYTQDAMSLQRLLQMVIDRARAKRGYLGRPLPQHM